MGPGLMLRNALTRYLLRAARMDRQRTYFNRAPLAALELSCTSSRARTPKLQGDGQSDTATPRELRQVESNGERCRPKS